MRPGVLAHGVRRSFGEVEALRGADLHAPPGEITALVGPNGAGKTTLLLVLATLLAADAGQVSVAGYDPSTQTDEVRARTGWTPDVFGLYENLTAREYLEFFAAAYRLPRTAQRGRAAELLALTHLDDLADRPVHTLSRGQKQRLGVARALVHAPEVLLLDEPAAGLDPRSRVDLRDLLRRLAGDGTTVVVSSHVLGDLDELADSAVFVEGGRTVGARRMSELAGARARWRVRALDHAALVAALSRTGRVFEVTGTADQQAALAEVTGEADAAELVAQLVADGVRLVECAPAGGALEAAYLALMQERT